MQEFIELLVGGMDKSTVGTVILGLILLHNKSKSELDEVKKTESYNKDSTSITLMHEHIKSLYDENMRMREKYIELLESSSKLQEKMIELVNEVEENSDIASNILSEALSLASITEVNTDKFRNE